MTKNGSTRLLLSLVGMGLIGAGCGVGAPMTENEVDKTQEALYVVDHTWPWPNQAIPVCWENDHPSDPQRASEAKAAIKGSWTRKAGIYFSGWKKCSEEAGMIKLKWVEDPHGRSSSDSVGWPSGFLPVNIKYDPDASDYAIIHEVGHALGFAHEQNRPDNSTCRPCAEPTVCTSDSQCTYGYCAGFLCSPCADNETCEDGFCRQGHDGDTMPTSYDESSIMSYCGPRTSKLSRFDVVGARISYSDNRPIKILSPANLCLGVQGVDSHQSGARVETYYCGPDASDLKVDEEWSLRPTSDGYYKIVNMLKGLCLGVIGYDTVDEHAAAEVYKCDPPSGQQWLDEEWKIVEKSNGYVALENRARAGYYLAVPPIFGGPAEVFVTSDTTESFIWKLVDPTVTHQRVTSTIKPIIKLANAASGLCAGVQGKDLHLDAEALAEVYHCKPNGSDARQDEEWVVEPTEGSYFRLKNARNGYCLAPQSTSRAALVQVSDCDLAPTNSNQWKWKAGNQPYVYTQRLVNRAANLCLGVRGYDNHSAGELLEIYDCDSTNGDVWLDENWIAY